MSIQQSMIAGYSSVPFVITNSGDFERATAEYLSQTQGDATTAEMRTNTFSSWIHRESGGQTTAIMGSVTAEWGCYTNASNYIVTGQGNGAFSNQYASDVLANATWYHLVIVYDSTAASGSRNRYYIDGTQLVETTENEVALNTNSEYFANKEARIGRWFSTQVWDGLMSQTYWLAGSHEPTEFAYNDGGTWTAKAYSGAAMGGNDTYLKYENSGNLGENSADGGDWTNNNTVTQSASVPPFGNG
mgnify:CR=1 FL=1|tara:strand:- start:2851 stop:3585 length:735 start_codon:yes stop_codon:yes gene_type:complete